MFEIKEAFSKGPAGDTLMVIDEERDVWLQYLGGLGSEPGSCFKLVWKGQAIGFDIRPDNQIDEEGNDYTIRRLFGFGDSINAEAKDGIKPWRTKDDEDRRQAKLLAVEALLAYGGFYDGYKHLDGIYRIEFEGRFYTKSDFDLP